MNKAEKKYNPYMLPITRIIGSSTDNILYVNKKNKPQQFPAEVYSSDLPFDDPVDHLFLFV